MATQAPVPRKIRLKHTLIGYPPYHPEGRETIPEGAEITVTDYDHTETDSLVVWNGRTLIVDKNSLTSFEEPI
jgi:hypothetical protein